MKARTRTLAVGLAAAVVALGGGALVADASNHASFASSATQDGAGSFGRPMGQPPGPGFSPPPGAPAGAPGGGGGAGRGRPGTGTPMPVSGSATTLGAWSSSE